MAFYSEHYEVVETVELVANFRTPSGPAPTAFRIEALRDLTGNYPQPFSIRAYRQVELTLQPTYPQQNGEFVSEPESFSVWVYHHLAVLPADSQEFVMRRALSFLSELCAE